MSSIECSCDDSLLPDEILISDVDVDSWLNNI